MMPYILTRSLNRSATWFLLIVAAVGIFVPLSNLLLPPSSPFHVPTYLVALLGKYLCYAILAISLVTSKGAHGVPGSAIVVLAATLQAIPAIPAIGLVLVLSVDWFMGIARALGNLIGNCVATVAVAAWEGDIDRERAHAVLDGLPVPATEDDADVAPNPVPVPVPAPAHA